MIIKEKKKRVSKKNKSSWRKHVNIQDVDDFLEDQRLEERLGPPLADLKNEQLFTLETQGNEDQLTVKQKKRLRLALPPKCFAMLQPHSKVQDPIKKRNRVRTKEERMCPILRRKENERKLKGILKAKELQSINDRKKYEKKMEEKNVDCFVTDIWNVQDSLESDLWLEKNTKRHILRGTGNLNKVIPRMRVNKNTAIPNIETPHPGTSYNPSYQDHQNLLQDIVKKETKIIKEEKHINRVTKDMFRKIPQEEIQAIRLKEMSEGLLPEDQQKNENDQDSDDKSDKPYKSVNAPVENKKKTLKQRRKQKEQLLIKEALLLKKIEKKKRTDLHKLNLIKEQIAKRDKKLEKQKLRREKIKMLKLKEPKRLSKLKYEEPDVDFNMGQDIAGNLRNVKKEGNLLTDRFRSLQKRNILQVTASQNRKKAKVKKFVKSDFKDGWKKTVAKANLLSTK